MVSKGQKSGESAEIRYVRLSDISCLRRMSVRFTRFTWIAGGVAVVALGVFTYLTAGVLPAVVGSAIAGLLITLVLAGFSFDIPGNPTANDVDEKYVSYLSTPEETEQVKDLSAKHLGIKLRRADINYCLESDTISNRFYELDYEYVFVPSQVPALRVYESTKGGRRLNFIFALVASVGAIYYLSATLIATLGTAATIVALGVLFDEFPLPYMIEVGVAGGGKIPSEYRRFPLANGDRGEFARSIARQAGSYDD